MAPDELLVSLSGLSVTLAGFAAVFKAFSRKQLADQHSSARLNSIVELGFAVTLLAFSPQVLASLGMASEASIRVMSIAGAAYYVRWLIELWAIRNLENRTPKTYLTACITAGVIFVLFVLITFAMVSPILSYFMAALLLMFFFQGIAFMSEFWAESQSDRQS